MKKILAVFAASTMLIGATALPASAVTKSDSGSIGCSSNAATTKAYGSGYLTLKAPGATSKWTSPYHTFNATERATVFKTGSWSAYGSKYLSMDPTYAYCR